MCSLKHKCSNCEKDCLLCLHALMFFIVRSELADEMDMKWFQNWSKEKLICFQHLLQIRNSYSQREWISVDRRYHEERFYVSKTFSHTTVAGWLQVIDLTWHTKICCSHCDKKFCLFWKGFLKFDDMKLSDSSWQAMKSKSLKEENVLSQCWY